MEEQKLNESSAGTKVLSVNFSLLWTKSVIPPLQPVSPLGGPCQNIVMTFGIERLEWCGYLTVKFFFDNILICFDKVHEHDGRMDTACKSYYQWGAHWYEILLPVRLRLVPVIAVRW